jgi:hypothetical protein
VPCALCGAAEIHGVFEAGLQFLLDRLAQREGPREPMSDEDVVRIVNDLTEKSIRNFSIIQDWSNATTKSN